MDADRRQIGLSTATLLVIASMIGTGVFTTTGFLWAGTPSVPIILSAWFGGGVLALFGALNYAELTAALPRNGGEYQLLSRIYHPAVGFVCGWAAFIAGFAAPVGGTAMAFGEYLERVIPGVSPTTAATALILIVAGIHSYRVREGNRFQDIFTLGKTLLIVGFVIAGALAIFSGPPVVPSPSLPQPDAGSFSLSALATGLVFISYSYLGWNAACYIAGELRSPGRNIPRALLMGTGCVTLLYLALNAVFLCAGDPSELAGELEIADIVANTLWGPGAAKVVSAIIAVGLVSTVGALTVTGPRIYEVMGEDFSKLSFLTYRPKDGGPLVGIALQTIVALIAVYTATYDQVLIYVGITLSLFGVLTVLGVTVLRIREPDLERPYRAWGQPWTGLIYSALMIGMVALTIMAEPGASVAAGGTLAAGFLLFVFVRDRSEKE